MNNYYGSASANLINTMDMFLEYEPITFESSPNPPQTVPHFTYPSNADDDPIIRYTNLVDDWQTSSDPMTGWEFTSHYQPMPTVDHCNRVQNMQTRIPSGNTQYANSLYQFLSYDSQCSELIDTEKPLRSDRILDKENENEICETNYVFYGSNSPQMVDSYDKFAEESVTIKDKLIDNMLEGSLSFNEILSEHEILSEYEAALKQPTEFNMDEIVFEFELPVPQKDIPKATEESKEFVEEKKLLIPKLAEKEVPIVQEIQVEKPQKRRPGRPRKNPLVNPPQTSKVITPVLEISQDYNLPERKAKLRCLNFSYDEPLSPTPPQNPTKRSKISTEEDTDYFPEEEEQIAEVKTKDQKRLDREKNNKASKKSRDKKKEMQIQQERLRDRLLEEHNELKDLKKRLEDALDIFSKKS